jgi:hypothetical protein
MVDRHPRKQIAWGTEDSEPGGRFYVVKARPQTFAVWAPMSGRRYRQHTNCGSLCFLTIMVFGAANPKTSSTTA